MLEISETELDSKLTRKSIVIRAQSETKSIEKRSGDICSNEVITFEVSVPNAVIASMAFDYIYNNDFQVVVLDSSFNKSLYPIRIWLRTLVGSQRQ